MTIRVLTHDGPFHTDEVVACALLQMAYPRDMLEITRSRNFIDNDPTTFNFVVDVAGVYDGIQRFDHHQVSAPTRPNGAPYASAGLVWNAFASLIIQHHVGCSPEDVQQIFEDIDRTIMIPIDASDNGKTIPYPLSIQQLISSFNTTWNSPNENNDGPFNTVMLIVQQWLGRVLEQSYSKILARTQLVLALAEAKEQGRSWIDLGVWIPFRTMLFEIPAEIHYALYPGMNGDHRIECIPIVGSMVSRKPLPEAWWGKEKEELSGLAGVPDAIFCHKTGFICSAKSKDSTQKMLALAILNK